jgi:hypothetical protein
MTIDGGADLEMLLRRVIREETGISPAAPAEKWRGGTFVLRPGTPGLQEKSWPIETFFHKVGDAAEPPAHARAAGERRRHAGRTEGAPAGATSAAATAR